MRSTDIFATVVEPDPIDGPGQVTVVREGHDRRPILLLIGGWNALFVYDPLIRHLPEEIGVIAMSLAPSDEDPLSTVLDDIQGSATFIAGAAAEVVRDRPGRPLVPLGYSRGGLVAYDFAQRFDTRPGAVRLQVLVDTIYPGEETRRPELVAAARRVKYRRLIESKAYGSAIKELGASLVARVRRIAVRAGRALMSVADDERSEARLPGEIRSLTEDDYLPPRSDVPVVVYRASTSEAERTTDRWREVATDVTEVVIEGRHGGETSILQGDRVDELATDLTRRLADLVD